MGIREARQQMAAAVGAEVIAPRAGGEVIDLCCHVADGVDQGLRRP